MSKMQSPDISNYLPADRFAGSLIGRVWLHGTIPGPAVVAIRADGVFDLSRASATVSALLERDDPAAWVQSVAGQRIGSDDLRCVVSPPPSPETSGTKAAPILFESD